MRGAGTALNVATVLVGSSIGVLLGHRLPDRTREVVTDALGLVTLLVAALSAASVLDNSLGRAVGARAPVLIVLGSLLLGGIAGSLLRIEDRLEGIGGALQRRFAPRSASNAGARLTDPLPASGDSRTQAGRHRRPGVATPGTGPRAETTAQARPVARPRAAHGQQRFIEGFVTASLVFCVGPLTILGSLSDGLGRGIDQLALKAVLDGFAAIAFAASFGWGVAASALTILVVQGSLTVIGFALGGFLPDAHIAALTATGGLLLVGVGLRLLRIRQVPVGDLLPALIIAPLLVEAVVTVR
jgi:uncharacterized membrane protein YqgA involved in biofilm formation